MEESQRVSSSLGRCPLSNESVFMGLRCQVAVAAEESRETSAAAKLLQLAKLLVMARVTSHSL